MPVTNGESRSPNNQQARIREKSESRGAVDDLPRRKFLGPGSSVSSHRLVCEKIAQGWTWKPSTRSGGRAIPSERYSTNYPTLARRPVLRRNALRKLGVTEEQLRAAPVITPMLHRIAGLQGGLEHDSSFAANEAAVGYLRMSEEPDARKVVDIFDRTKLSLRARYVVPMEAYCIAAGVSPNRVLELVVATMVRAGAQLDTIITAARHHELVEKSITIGLTDGGIDDRMAVHRATGYVPTPRGSRTIISLSQQTSQIETRPRAVLPPMDTVIRQLSDRFNERLLAENEHALSAAETPRLPPVDESGEDER